MRKYILLGGVITVVLLNVSWGYVVTVKQKLVGFLQITSTIENVRYLEITRDVVYFEVAEGADWVQLNYNCSDVINIFDDSNSEIYFDCDELKKDSTLYLGESALDREESRAVKNLNQDSHSAKNSQLKNDMITNGYAERIDLSKQDINIEDNVVTISVESRRTNVKSTIIKTYWLCGAAMNRNNLSYSEIRVIVTIRKKQTEKIVATANGRDVIQLGKSDSPGYASFGDFMEKLKVYRYK